MADLKDQLHDNAKRPAEHGIGNARIVERSSRDIIDADKYLKSEEQPAKTSFGIVFAQSNDKLFLFRHFFPSFE